MTVISFNIWCIVPNFIKIGRFLTEIWRFNDFQNGGRQPSWILKTCSFCHVVLADIPFCLLIQSSLKSNNRSMSYGQKSDFHDGGRRHLKFLKNSIFGQVTVIGFNIWCRVPNFIKIRRFLTEIWRFSDFQNGGHPPSWILKFAVFVTWLLSAYRSAS